MNIMYYMDHYFIWPVMIFTSFKATSIGKLSHNAVVTVSISQSRNLYKPNVIKVVCSRASANTLDALQCRGRPNSILRMLFYCALSALHALCLYLTHRLLCTLHWLRKSVIFTSFVYWVLISVQYSS